MMISAYIIPGSQNSNVNNKLIQNLLFTSPSCRYTARGGNSTARIHNNTVLSLASRPAFFSFLKAFNADLTSLMRALLSFFESDLNSSIAAFTVAESGSEPGTIGEEEEAGTTRAAWEEKLIDEARIKNANSKNDRFIVVNFSLVKTDIDKAIELTDAGKKYLPFSPNDLETAFENRRIL